MKATTVLKIAKLLEQRKELKNRLRELNNIDMKDTIITVTFKELNNYLEYTFISQHGHYDKYIFYQDLKDQLNVSLLDINKELKNAGLEE